MTTATIGLAGVCAEAGLFPTAVELSDLLADNGGDGSRGLVIKGIDNADQAGRALCAAGDVNDDGISDIIIGALVARQGDLSQAGETYVVFGTDTSFNAEIDLADFLIANGGDGSAGFVLQGFAADNFAGRSACGIGDVNADGIDDIALGASGADPDGRDNAGQVYVLFGSAAGFAAEISLADLLASNGADGSLGFVINGVADNDFLGTAVAPAGDVNADGKADLLLGALGADPGGRSLAGAAYVLFGSDQGFGVEFELSSLLGANGGDGSAGYVLNGNESTSRTGIAADGIGDVNGDGVDDVLVGADFARPGGFNQAGESFVVFGGSSTGAPERDLSALLFANGGDGSAGFVLNGTAATDLSGATVAAAGDINGDGIPDMLIGADSADPDGLDRAGRAYLIFGSDLGFPPEIDLETLLPENGGDGTVGVVFEGQDEIDFAGSDVSAAGDVNQDGFDDLIIGVRASNPGNRAFAGQAYVVYGTDAAFPAVVELDFAQPVSGGVNAPGFVINGNDSGDLLGSTVASAGDVNGDGAPDILLGAPNASNDAGAPQAGEIYVVFGRTDTDGDDVADSVDNCTLVANPLQRDVDEDGIGSLCDPDFNNDCIINVSDLGILRSAFFSADANVDLNGDGVVNAVDLGILRTFFFSPPGPAAMAVSCQ